MADNPVCPETGAPMLRDARPMTLNYKGQSITFDMPGWYCDASDQSTHTGEDMKVSDRMLNLLKARSDAELKAWVRKQFGIDAPVGYTNTYANWGVKDVNIPLPHDATWLANPAKTHHCVIPLVAAQVHSNGNVSICPCDDFDADAGLSLGNLAEDALAEGAWR